jgi:hypothetical protein
VAYYNLHISLRDRKLLVLVRYYYVNQIWKKGGGVVQQGTESFVLVRLTLGSAIRPKLAEYFMPIFSGKMMAQVAEHTCLFL